VTSTHWRLRAAALLSLGAFGVHQLRYLIAYGDGSRRELALQGHGYLTFVGPLIAVVVVLALAEFALRLADARRTGSGPAPVPGFRRLWAGATLLLLLAFGLQESLEGAIAAGHPGGFAAIFGGGGWMAVPLAVVAGFVVALALRVASRALELASRPATRVWLPASTQTLRLSDRSATRAGRTLALHLGGRGPPQTSVA
jgi:hypothetical protein